MDEPVREVVILTLDKEFRFSAEYFGWMDGF